MYSTKCFTKLPSEISQLIDSYIPPHPLQRQISMWSRKQYFYKWFFERNKQKCKKYNKDSHYFWSLDQLIKYDGHTNEGAIKLHLASKKDKKRMMSKLDSLGIKSYEVKTCTHFPKLNKHGNMSEVYYNGVEIIY